MNPTTSKAQETLEHADVAGKVALVTGGAKRVGAAIALKLAHAGFDVAITYQHSADEAREITAQIQSLGRRALAIGVDLAEPSAADVIHKHITTTFGRLDALINNASIFSPSPLPSVSVNDFEKNMAINARAPLLLIQRFASMLAAHHDPANPATTGRVVNFVDIHVMGQTLRSFVAYNASKAALMEITMSCAMELAPAITVNAIAPGVVAWAESYNTEQREQYLRRVPLGRAGTPEDAATAVLFLVRDAHYCTGQIIKLDGGRAMT